MNEQDNNSARYLINLKQALNGQSASLIQDVIHDTQSHIFEAFAEQSTISYDTIVEELGTPHELAEQYIQLEQDAQRFLQGPESSKKTFNGFFEPLCTLQDFKSLGYFLISVPLSLVYFAWFILVGMTSLCLSVLVVGLPVLAGFLKIQTYVALFEGQLINAFLGARMPRRPASRDSVFSQKITLQQSITSWLKAQIGWTTTLYTALLLPLSTIYCALSCLLFAGSLALTLSPIVDPILHFFVPSLAVDINWYWLPLTSMAGVIGMTLSLHISRALVKLHTSIAQTLLIAR